MRIQCARKSDQRDEARRGRSIVAISSLFGVARAYSVLEKPINATRRGPGGMVQRDDGYSLRAIHVACAAATRVRRVRRQHGSRCPWNEYPITTCYLTRAVGAFYLARRPCPTPKSETEGIRSVFFKRQITDRGTASLRNSSRCERKLECGAAHVQSEYSRKLIIARLHCGDSLECV